MISKPAFLSLDQAVSANTRRPRNDNRNDTTTSTMTTMNIGELQNNECTRRIGQMVALDQGEPVSHDGGIYRTIATHGERDDSFRKEVWNALNRRTTNFYPDWHAGSF
jgi:hypothetical protein